MKARYLLLSMALALLLATTVLAVPKVYIKDHKIDTADEGATIIKPVYIKDAVDFYGTGFDVALSNGGPVDYNSIEYGTWLASGGVSTIEGDAVGLPKVTETYLDDVYYSRRGEGPEVYVPGVDGSGLILTIVFDKVADGEVEFTLQNLDLFQSTDATPLADYEIYRLASWSDADVGTSIVVNSPGTIYAQLIDRASDPVLTACELVVGTGTPVSMIYDSATETYRADYTFTSTGLFSYRVICDSFFESTGTVEVTACSAGAERSCTPAGGEEACTLYRETCTAEGTWSGTCQAFEDPACPQDQVYLSTNVVTTTTGDFVDVVYHIRDLLGVQGYQSTTYTTPSTATSYASYSEGDIFSFGINDYLYVEPFADSGGIAHAGVSVQDSGVGSGELITLRYRVREGGEALFEGRDTLLLDINSNELFSGTVSATETLPDQACETQLDPGCECINGQTETCGPQTDTGVCAFGTRSCNSGIWGTCEGAVLAGSEICDGLDNDCDGATDENAQGQTLARSCYSGPAGTSGVGICAQGTSVCSGGSYGACQGEVTPASSEVCGDSLDNTCDGTVDEGCECSPGQTRSCGSDVGQCIAGTQTCTSSGTWPATCEGSIGPSTEVCDELDNDCDGTADEELLCTQDSDGDGVVDADDRCPATPDTYVDKKGETKVVEVNAVGCPKPGWLRVRLENEVSNLDMTRVESLVLADNVESNGDITYKEPVDLLEDITVDSITYRVPRDLDEIVRFEDNSVGVDVSAAAGLNKPARLRIFRAFPSDASLPANSEIHIFKGASACPSPACEKISIIPHGWQVAANQTNQTNTTTVNETNASNITKQLEVVVDVAGFSFYSIKLASELPHCGDGMVNQDSEQCDDGNDVSLDGCSTSCTLNAGWTCSGEPSSCSRTPEETSSSSSGGGGGGGGGGSYLTLIDRNRESEESTSCTEVWSCTPWGDCTEGKQTRTCEDLNDCGTIFRRPSVVQSCDNPCSNGVKDFGEEGIDCGGSCGHIRECQIYEEVLRPQLFKVEGKLDEGKVNLYYDAQGKQTGVSFKIELYDDQDRLITEETFGPLTVDGVLDDDVSVASYLFKDGDNVRVKGFAYHQGTLVESYEDTLLLSNAPINVFLLRVGAAFAAVGLLAVIAVSIFRRYMR